MKKIKINMFAMAVILFAGLFLTGCNNDSETSGEGTAPSQYEGKLLILQAYGSSSNAAGISHSFVELYNKTENAINLSGISLYYADGTSVTANEIPNTATEDGEWKKIALTGNIPAKGSFLILGPKQSATAARYQIPDNSGDINSSEFTLSNRAFKAAIIEGNAELTAQNPFNTDGAGTKVAGYIDMVGAANEYGDDKRDKIFGFEIYPARNSASAAARRINLNDTNDNGDDFESLDYRQWSISNPERMTDEQLARYKPKNSTYGAWNPLTGEKTGNIATGVTIKGNGVKEGALEINMEGQITLSAGVVPLDADKTGITYTWSVSDESPSGVITLPSLVNTAAITITAAKEGTAKVTLAITGGGIITNIVDEIEVTVTVPSWPTGSAKLMILQIGASADDSNNISHSFIELYNNTAQPIVLTDTYSIQYAAGYSTGGTGGDPQASSEADGPWIKIDLTGTIAPYSSFLILGPRRSTMPVPGLNINNDSGDMNVLDFKLNNRALKVVLLSSQTLLADVQNPFDPEGDGSGENSSVAGYIDMIGVINDGTNGEQILGQEGTLALSSGTYNISKQIALRRVNLNDTDVNSTDFIRIQYNNTNPTVPENLKDFAYPKNQDYGAWNPITGEKID